MELLELIGNTPLVELNQLNENKNVRVLAKLEGQNPGGSVKDRAAFFMIKNALERGSIDKHTRLIEPTSGNTGIALAMIASMYGLRMELVMPENASKERVQTMRAYGATVSLTPADKSMEGAIDYAREKVQAGGCFMLDQFSNADNVQAHIETTGPEVYRDTDGKVTHFVSSMGTTGTITGTSIYLKSKNPEIQIVGAQPSDGACIPGIRRWGADYLPKIYQAERVDQIIDVSQEAATQMTRKLAQREGLFAGMSSGGAVHIALELAKTLNEGTIVAIICDRGDRYLSTTLFEE